MISLSTKSVASRRRLIQLLGVSALTIVCLGSVVALAIYVDSHSAISAEMTVSHTQDVLLNLNGVAQQLDRMDLHARLYRATGEEDQLRAAQGAALNVNTRLERLADLVREIPLQEQRAHILVLNSANLTKLLDEPKWREATLRDQVMNFRRTLNLMQDQQRILLAQRQTEAEHNEFYAMTRRVAVIGIGAAMVIVMFGFLIRDAIHRAKFENRLSEANERLRSTVQRLEQQAWEAKLLNDARDEVGLCLDVAQAQACTVRFLAELLPGTGGSLCVIDNSRQILECVGTWGGLERVSFDGFEPESCCALRTGRTRWRRPEKSEVHCTHYAGKAPERYVCLPLLAHGETIGMLTVESPTGEIAFMTEQRETTLSSLGEMAAMAIAGLRLRQKLENQSIRDGMTGLFNRSFMEIALEREIHRSSRQGRQIAVMMADVDHFKQFNDTFGHEAGDAVLREVAEALRLGVRGEDIVCRYGGEEFVIIMPEISLELAMERAELLRRSVSELAVRSYGEPLRPVTISIGVAIFPQNADRPQELLRSADRALYAAKHQGRNRVVRAPISILV